MKKLGVLLGFLAIVGAYFCFSNARPTHAAGGSDVWQVGPNCVGVTNTAQHYCDFVRNQLGIAPYDQWNIVVVEPGKVTGVTCQTTGPNIFQFMGAFNGDKRNPWEGSHYGNVGICRGWINGGNGPVKITANYE